MNLNPAGNAPERRELLQKIRNLQTRTLISEKMLKALVAVGQVAALVYALRGCS